MKVPSTEVQNNFGKYLKFVEAGEVIIVTKKGREVASITSPVPAKPDYVMESTGDYQSDARVSYEQFLELVENSEQRYELIDGVIYNLASPSFKHQLVVHELH